MIASPLVSPPAPRLVHLDSCPVCRSGKTAFFFASLDLMHGVPGLFSYGRCTSCSSFFQNPRVADDDLSLCYPSGYFTHAAGGPELTSAEGWLQGRLRQQVLRARSSGSGVRVDVKRWFGRLLSAIGFIRRRAMFGLVDELRPPVGLDRCLELGPGTGDDMWRLSQLGWKVTGLDLDPDAADHASTRSDCQVVVGSILDHRPDQPYGLIYGSHSIEHVPNIRETILHLRTLLGECGSLVLIIPNATSISSRLHGPLSAVWDPPRHLSLPSIQALKTMFSEAGFHGVKVRTSPRRAAHYNAIARARRDGTTGTAAWEVHPTPADRLLQVVETVLVGLGGDVGEEIVVSATVG